MACLKANCEDLLVGEKQKMCTKLSMRMYTEKRSKFSSSVSGGKREEGRRDGGRERGRVKEREYRGIEGERERWGGGEEREEREEEEQEDK